MRDLIAEPEPDVPGDAWADAALAAALVALDPASFGGAVIRSRPGPVRDAWLALVRDLSPEGMPLRRVPLGITADRLVGGLDLAATLAAGRPVAERGVLAEADGGMLVVPGAERVAPAVAAQITAALDTGHVALERDGLQARHPARVGVIALDEGLEPDEAAPAALTDRLAFSCDLSALSIREVTGSAVSRDEVRTARACLPQVGIGDAQVEALVAAAVALGIWSLRGTAFAVRAARGIAALDGRVMVEDTDLTLATQLVLAPRATRWPAEAEDPPEAPDETPEETQPETPPEDSDTPNAEGIADLLVQAAMAALPPSVLAQLAAGHGTGRATAGKAGQLRTSALRGRPIGTRRGDPKGGARLSVIETLRSAAPWQRLRGRTPNDNVQIRRDDFRIRRFKERSQTTTIFVVDASGSAALARLAEVKGAVELLLAEAYRRRDEVALISFRGREAELMLPPTRSLVRAKRLLAGLPGGGATPLATAIDAAGELAQSVRRRGATPIAVFLTDGKANIDRQGQPGRPQAMEDATAAARRLRTDGVEALVIDASPRPRPQAADLARAMAARYLPLPHADRTHLAQAVRDTATGAQPDRVPA